MKRIRIPTQMAIGKYAFTCHGYFNEGKHKFWAFQVRDSSKKANGDDLKAWTMAPKPKRPDDRNRPAPCSGTGSFTPAANVAPPTSVSGGRIAI
ncbi:MAG: hypothetical protein IPO41_13105 [Acidobacteria bacterium]|nr:hypothetical protein [Acidobacteriota bacterium]